MDAIDCLSVLTENKQKFQKGSNRMKEKKDLREACVKCFENADHSVTAAVYGKPVHFMEEDQWRTIDNHLYLEKDDHSTG